MSSNNEMLHHGWPEETFDSSLAAAILGEVGKNKSVDDANAELSTAITVATSIASLAAAWDQGFIREVRANISVGGYECNVFFPDSQQFI